MNRDARQLDAAIKNLQRAFEQFARLIGADAGIAVSGRTSLRSSHMRKRPDRKALYKRSYDRLWDVLEQLRAERRKLDD
jgi:hypothetical protein